MNILEQLGWFGDQDTKTSQEPKLWKIGKLGILINFQKGDITVVSEHDIGTWFGIIFMSTIIQVPPLYILTKSAFVEEETKSRRRRQFFGNYD